MNQIPIEKYSLAFEMAVDGYSIREISKNIGIAKGTALSIQKDAYDRYAEVGRPLKPKSVGGYWGHIRECTQCGRCCTEEVCELGIGVYKVAVTPCPALRSHDAKYWCGIVEEADSFTDMPWLRKHLELMLGIGVGCDASPPEQIRLPLS